MRHVIAIALVSVASTACLREVYSPPAGYLSLERPDRMAEGEHSIGASVGFGGLGLGADIVGGNVKYRRGMDAFELQAEGAVAVIDEDSKADTFPAIVSARVGLKGRLVADLAHFSWRVGGGLGGSAGGLFTGLDVGLSAGYENPYIVPFVSVFGHASVPVTSEDVDITKADDEETFVDHPTTSFGGGFTLGVGIHLGDVGDLNLGISRLQLIDIHGKNEGVVQLQLAFEVLL